MASSLAMRSPQKNRRTATPVSAASDQPNPAKLAQIISTLPTASLVEHAVNVDKDGEVVAGEDNLVLLQMEITDRIKQS